ncbi:MAG: phosphoribosylanthranilate isomerase [Methanimicrococcus sp.]|nr:phosphoribosylanthranilate isomerase [Methanimicrococcus sp.]
MCDIEAVNAFSPDYIGFVFAKSPRRVTPDQAADLRKRLSPNIIPVGVFVNEPIDSIMELIRSDVIEIIQLHGNETEEYVEKMKEMCENPIIKAVSVTAAGDVQRWENTCADYLLLDNKTGGTGESFDLRLIGNTKKPFFLAGGLNVENIEAAIQKTNPFAVDISSGVETDGLKDGEKIEKIISIVRRIRNG